MNFFLPTTLLAALFSLTGCGQDSSLDPPADSEQITVTIKVSEELEARAMKVMYRSTLCTFTDHSASGIAYKRDGYQRTDIQPVRRGQTDLYDAHLPMDGGGSCQWRLSNVTFGVIYSDPASFGENVAWGGGGGIIVIFDHNNSPRGAANFKVNGDVTIRKDYYPWLSEVFIGAYQKRISLASDGDIYLMYQALQARNVYFEPILHPDFVVHSAGPKVKMDGNFTSITYPDGSFVADGRHGPNFQKLQTIRLNAEAKQ